MHRIFLEILEGKDKVFPYLVHDPGQEEVHDAEEESGEGQDGEECHVHVPDHEEVEGEDSGNDPGVKVLVPAKQGVQQDHELPPFLQTRLDPTLIHGLKVLKLE